MPLTDSQRNELIHVWANATETPIERLAVVANYGVYRSRYDYLSLTFTLYTPSEAIVYPSHIQITKDVAGTCAWNYSDVKRASTQNSTGSFFGNQYVERLIRAGVVAIDEYSNGTLVFTGPWGERYRYLCGQKVEEEKEKEIEARCRRKYKEELDEIERLEEKIDRYKEKCRKEAHDKEGRRRRRDDEDD